MNAFCFIVLGALASTAWGEESSVTFTGLFPSPLADAARLGSGAAVHLALRIANRSASTWRFSSYRTVVPELLAPDGAPIAFDLVYNVSRLPQESDFFLLQPGESRVIPIEASLTWKGGRLMFRSADGGAGLWIVGDTPAVFRFRLRYVKLQDRDSEAPGRSGSTAAFWIGEAHTQAVELPLPPR